MLQRRSHSRLEVFMSFTSPAPILIEDLTLAYGDHRVLDGLSLRVEPGSITALLGGNGAGKSTT
ncbi:ATP-binding cassette domain-containing protein, partial [Sphingomonas sp. CCH9-F2]|uniref:ATP-binding cassette domain-containing protein n=1 Tax=Sphingomonas sp. CCH9-F2 TaxID=1768778 RepID=UPI003FA729FF